MNKKILVSFSLNCGRCGVIESLFVSNEKEINELIGAKLSFDEVLGKHSYVEHVCTKEDLKILSKDNEKIEWLISILGEQISGINIKEYISC